MPTYVVGVGPEPRSLTLTLWRALLASPKATWKSHLTLSLGQQQGLSLVSWLCACLEPPELGCHFLWPCH